MTSTDGKKLDQRKMFFLICSSPVLDWMTTFFFLHVSSHEYHCSSSKAHGVCGGQESVFLCMCGSVRMRQTDKETDRERKGSQSSNINISTSEVERKKGLNSYENRQMESYHSGTGGESHGGRRNGKDQNKGKLVSERETGKSN